MVKGPIAEFPVVSTKIGLTDGSFHDVDSSDMAFQTCAKNCFRETFMKTKPVLLEPVMKMEVEVPAEYQGPVAGELTSRRGIIVGTDLEGPTAVIEAHVPLAETFGVFDRPAQHDAGTGHFFDGVLVLSASTGPRAGGRSCREESGKGSQAPRRGEIERDRQENGTCSVYVPPVCVSIS